MKARTIIVNVVFFLILLVAISIPASIILSPIIRSFTLPSVMMPASMVRFLTGGSIILLFLMAWGIYLAVLALSRLPGRGYRRAGRYGMDSGR